MPLLGEFLNGPGHDDDYDVGREWRRIPYLFVTAVPDNNDIEAIFTWRGYGRSFVGFLSGNDGNYTLIAIFCFNSGFVCLIN